MCRLLNAAGCYTDANIRALTSVMNLESVEVSKGCDVRYSSHCDVIDDVTRH
jgi:hypothetical protein